MALNFDPRTQRKKIPAFPSVFSLHNDPARFKSGFTGGGRADPDYVKRVEDFNRDLYQPSDTKQGRPEMPIILRPGVKPIGNGWEATGQAGARGIGARYGAPAPAFEFPDYPDEQNASAGPSLANIKFPEVVRPQNGQGSTLPETVWGDEEDGGGIQPPVAAGSSITSTDRYYARAAARNVNRKSPLYPEARRFLRIDGSAPQSSRDTLRPPAVDFTGNNMAGGHAARGFGATPEETSQEIQEGFGWKGPMTYGDLKKKYQFGGT